MRQDAGHTEYQPPRLTLSKGPNGARISPSELRLRYIGASTRISTEPLAFLAIRTLRLDERASDGQRDVQESKRANREHSERSMCGVQIVIGYRGRRRNAPDFDRYAQCLRSCVERARKRQLIKICARWSQLDDANSRRSLPREHKKQQRNGSPSRLF